MDDEEAASKAMMQSIAFRRKASFAMLAGDPDYQRYQEAADAMRDVAFSAEPSSAKAIEYLYGQQVSLCT